MPLAFARGLDRSGAATTFENEIGEVALVPGTGGVFEVRVDDEVIFSRAEKGRFPESAELKQRVRDRIAPDKPLGHSDRKPVGGKITRKRS